MTAELLRRQQLLEEAEDAYKELVAEIAAYPADVEAAVALFPSFDSDSGAPLPWHGLFHGELLAISKIASALDREIPEVDLQQPPPPLNRNPGGTMNYTFNAKDKTGLEGWRERHELNLSNMQAVVPVLRQWLDEETEALANTVGGA